MTTGVITGPTGVKNGVPTGVKTGRSAAAGRAEGALRPAGGVRSRRARRPDKIYLAGRMSTGRPSGGHSGGHSAGHSGLHSGGNLHIRHLKRV